MNNEIFFNEKERALLQPQLQQMNTIMTAVQNAIGMFCASKDLDPQQWRLKQDGSGLEKIAEQTGFPPVA